MRRLLPLLVLLVACAGRQTTATTSSSSIAWPETLDHASTPETHREAAYLVLDASGLQPVMTAMIDVSLKSQLEVNPVLKRYEHVMRAFLEKYLSYAALRDDLAQAYVERFSELQLRQIGAFYGTPTGKLAVSKMPEMSRLGGEMGRRKVEEHQAELVEMLQKAERDAGTEY